MVDEFPKPEAGSDRYLRREEGPSLDDELG